MLLEPSHHRVFRVRFLFIPVLCWLSVVVRAQDSTQPSPANIKANVPLVLIPVTVTDKKGKFIDGLSADDFVVADEGVRQKIRMDTSDTVVAPVSLVVAIQCSGISAAVLAKIEKVGAMIQPLMAGDRGKTAVIAFDDEVRMFQDFTSDGSKIRIAFERIHGRVIKAGRMLDAASAGIKMLETRPESSRRILLILSESRDRGSHLKLPAVIEEAQRAGVLIYPATYSAHLTPWTARSEDNPNMPGGDAHSIDFITSGIELARLGKANAADAFALATGGRHLSFLTVQGLEEAIARAGEDIHSQYLLSFAPNASNNGGFHKLVVAVPSHGDAIVRARPGYWAQQ
jgi:VWFA-related protein